MLGTKAKSRILLFFILSVSFALIVFLVLKSLEENVVYFLSPSDVYNKPDISLDKTIRIGGKEIGRTRSQGPGRYTHIVVKEGLAIMPQGDEIFHGLTVEEHLDSGAFTPESWKNRKQKREEILEIFEPLKKLIHTPVGRLSGGERRMVSIGRGMMSEAKLYMADEPTLGLAPKIGKGVLEALLKIDLKNSAMIIAEQNVALLEGKVDRIIGMHAGKLKGEASSSLSMGLKN